VHQPELLLLDGLLDGLSQRDVAVVSKAIRDLAEDCAVLIAGCDGDALVMACDEILVLTDGVLVPAGL
jgi:ABC-type branched-subunit amino acid transport system ATPase component